jgi:hypothetical protein
MVQLLACELQFSRRVARGLGSAGRKHFVQITFRGNGMKKNNFLHDSNGSHVAQAAPLSSESHLVLGASERQCFARERENPKWL